MSALLSIFGYLAAQQVATNGGDGSPLVVTPLVGEGRFVRPSDSLALQLSRPLAPGRERLAVVIGGVDWTDLFSVDGVTLASSRGVAPLPSGDSQVAIYLVAAPREWRQIGTFAIRVTTAGGFESVEVVPATSVAYQTQLFDGHDPAIGAGASPLPQEATFTLGLRTRHVRGGTVVSTDTHGLASTNQARALRFGTSGADAPQIDISDYAWSVERSRGKIALGHGTFSPERHLMTNFISRGVSGTVRGPAGDVTLGALSGSNLVGAANFAGVAAGDNRVTFGVAGVDLARARPGAARLETSFVTGTRSTAVGFTQSQISDTQQSRGFGVRFLGAPVSPRWRIDTGLARARSTNPTDPLLAQELAVVDVKSRTSTAAYFDTNVDVVGSAAKPQFVALTAGYRLERVAPLFRSVGAAQGVRADLLQHALDVVTSIGSANVHVVHAWSHDNLGRVASILTTDTRTTTATVNAPPAFSRRGNSQAPAWWPNVSYSLAISAQKGRGIPELGGFTSASQVPDQRNVVHNARADWFRPRWRVSYNLNQSSQDNRQPGRETADLGFLSHQISVGTTAGTTLDVSADLSREISTNHEFDQRSATTRVGGIVNWRVTVRDLVSGIFSRATTGSGATISGTSATLSMTAQYARTIILIARPRSGRTPPQTQLFARLVWQSAGAPAFAGSNATSRRDWSIQAGATVTLF